MPSDYQMTGAIGLADGGITEVGHQGADVVIMTYGAKRITLDARRRDEFTRLYFDAEARAEAWAAEHAEVPGA